MLCAFVPRSMTVIDKRVVNIDELKLEHESNGDTFEWTSARVGSLLGAKDLGYSYDVVPPGKRACPDRKSTRLNSSHVEISYAVFCLKKKKKKKRRIQK